MARFLSSLAILALFFSAVVLLQTHNQAFVGEFGSEGDEAAHYVSALLVRTYLADGMPTHPMRYAEDYYLHYPKVAFGVWPPLFHLAGGVWMWLFSPSRAAMMLFIALASAATGFLVSRFVARDFGAGAGVISGLIFLTLPAVQGLSSKVMIDMLVALFSFAATACFARYLETEHWRDSALFGLLASAAILTKYNALALAFVPVLAIFLSGRRHLIRRATFWLPAAIVVAFAGPWYLKMRHLVWYAAQPVPGVADIPISIWRHLVGMTVVLQGILLLAVVAGLIDWWTARKPRDPQWAAVASQILAILVFHNFVYIGYDERYLSQAFPALVAFAIKGAVYAVRLVESRARQELVAGAMFALIPLIAFRPNQPWQPRKHYHGYTEIAAHIARDPAAHRILVSAENMGEGMLISELAMLENKPRHVVLRASKTLASASWMQQDYKLLHTPESALRLLQDTGVSLLVVDHGSGAPLAHHALVKEMVARYGAGWRKSSFRDVDVYRLPAVAPHPSKVRVDLRHTLGKAVEN